MLQSSILYADGYTILLTYTGTLCINPTLYPNAGYDPRKDERLENTLDFSIN